MAKSNTKDMSVGSPTKLIIGFAFPLLLGMLFQQIYGLMDTVIVGRFLGVSALAAVGCEAFGKFAVFQLTNYIILLTVR